MFLVQRLRPTIALAMHEVAQLMNPRIAIGEVRASDSLQAYSEG